MKTIVMIYSSKIAPYAVEKLFDGRSAVELSFDFPSFVPDVQKIVFFSDNETRKLCDLDSIIEKSVKKISVDSFKIVESEEAWTCGSLLKSMSLEAQGFETVVFGWADCPFYNETLVEKICTAHKEYLAEYTFADGYPEGLVPEVIDSGALKILSEIAKENSDLVTRDMLFSVMKKDINSFDVETILASEDFRSYRLEFNCETKRNALLCRRLFTKTKKLPTDCTPEDLCRQAVSDDSILRTLPAFFNIQISSACNGGCAFCVWPELCRKLNGSYPSEVVDRENKKVFMDIEQFKVLLKKIVDFCGDAVISLSLWGESTRHPLFLQFISEVLKYRGLSLLIETDASFVTDEFASNVGKIVGESLPRNNHQKAVNWIVSIDSADDDMYAMLHNNSQMTLEKAIEAVHVLKKHFSGAVYPQFLRMKENENQLEKFYRFWKADGKGELIVQKYDNYAGLLPDKKVADLSPVIKNPCWHLRRDMNILVDGRVPVCKTIMAKNLLCNERLEKENDCFLGNVFDEDIETVWKRGDVFFNSHLNKKYTSDCRECDEYYTFNF